MHIVRGDAGEVLRPGGDPLDALAEQQQPSAERIAEDVSLCEPVRRLRATPVLLSARRDQEHLEVARGIDSEAEGYFADQRLVQVRRVEQSREVLLGGESGIAL